MENDIVITPIAQTKKHSPKVYIYITSTLLLAVAVTVFVVTTFILPYDDNIVEVLDYNKFENNIPDNTKKIFAAQLYNQLKTNFDVPYQRGAVKATIRPETYEENINIATTGSFVLDIDDYQQTFQVNLAWSNSDVFIPESVVLKCTTRTLSKYPDAMCYGMYTTSDSISLYLPRETTLDSGEKVILQYDYIDSDGVQNLKVLVENCGNQSIKNAALNAAKEHIDSLGLFKASDYKYNIPSIYNNCVVK